MHEGVILYRLDPLYQYELQQGVIFVHVLIVLLRFYVTQIVAGVFFKVWSFLVFEDYRIRYNRSA